VHNQPYVHLCAVLQVTSNFTSPELCLFIRDGLKKLESGPVGLYVPDVNFDAIEKHMGKSPVYAHLVTADASNGDDKSDQLSPTSVILKVLDLAAEDFSPEVPLTTYGLDSLSAARLSFQLRSLVQVTQMQLLAHMTLNDIMAKISVAVEEVAADQGETATAVAVQSSASTTKELMLTLADRYSGRFRRPETSGISSPSGKVVIVTGTTGAVGCGILVDLATDPSVSRVFALNRPSEHSPLLKRQMKALEQQDLSLTEQEWAKVILVESVVHHAKLGVSDDLYHEVCRLLRSRRLLY
jgi:aryl carrier-like protein